MKQVELCLEGAINLAKAIVKQAVREYMSWPPDSMLRHEAKKFLETSWFRQLSGVSSDTVLEWLDQKYTEKYAHRIRGMQRPS